MKQKTKSKGKSRPFSDFSQQLKSWQQTQDQAEAVAKSTRKGPDKSQTIVVRHDAVVAAPEKGMEDVGLELSDAALFTQAVDAISDSSAAILQKYSRAEQHERPPQSSETPAHHPQKTKQVADRALFLQAVGDLTPLEVSRAKPQIAVDAEKNGARFRVRVQRGDFHPHASIDLHGDSREQAEKRLRTFLRAEQHKRSEIVLVVHGKGLGILATEVRDVLDAEPSVAEHVPAPPGWGGEGARMVRLRNRRKGAT